MASRKTQRKNKTGKQPQQKSQKQEELSDNLLITVSLVFIVGLVLGLSMGFVFSAPQDVETVSDADVVKSALAQGSYIMELSETANGFKLDKEVVETIPYGDGNLAKVKVASRNFQSPVEELLFLLDKDNNIEMAGYSSLRGKRIILINKQDFENEMLTASLLISGELNESEDRLQRCARLFNENEVIRNMILAWKQLPPGRGKLYAIPTTLTCDNVTHYYTLKIEDGLVTTTIENVSTVSDFEAGVVGQGVEIPKYKGKEPVLSIIKSGKTLNYNFRDKAKDTTDSESSEA